MIESTEKKIALFDKLWNLDNQVEDKIVETCKGLFQSYKEFCIFVIKGNNPGDIYLIPFNENARSSLRDEIFAFWGVDEGIMSEVHEQNNTEIDDSILNATRISFYKLRSNNENQFQQLVEKLNLFIKVKSQSKVLLHFNVFSLEELISSFNNALILSDFNTAQRYLQEINTRPDISVINKVFLSIKYNYIIGNWDYIVRHDQLLSLKHMRRPKIITEYILMAHFNKFIRPVVSDLETVQREFSENIWRMISSMLTFDENYTNQEIYLLLALAVKQKSNPTISEMKSVRNKLEEYRVSDLSAQKYLDLITIPDIPNQINIPKLKDLNDSGNYDDLVTMLESDVQSISLQSFEYALKIPPYEYTDSIVKRVHKLYESLDEAIKEQINTKPALAKAFEHIKTAATQKEITIDGWFELVRIGNDENQILSQFDELINNIEYQKVTDQTIEQLNLLFRERRNHWVDQVKQLIPLIVKNLENINVSKITLKWKLDLLKYIVSIERIGNSDIELINSIVDIIIKDPLSRSDFEDLVLCLMLFWDKIQSPNILLWPVEIIDEILDSNSAYKILLDDFISVYIEFLFHHRNSLSGSNLAIIKKFFEQDETHLNQLTALIADHQLANKCSRTETYIKTILAKVKIGIYSLMEPAANRAKRYFETINNEANIELNHDKACTEILENLYKGSDIFVFAAKAAKHQAYKCIGRDKIIYPSGKGASSIIRVISDELLKYGDFAA